MKFRPGQLFLPKKAVRAFLLFRPPGVDSRDKRILPWSQITAPTVCAKPPPGQKSQRIFPILFHEPLAQTPLSLPESIDPMHTDFSKLYNRHRLGIRPGLQGITHLLERLGNPQNHFPAIHVAGTNGKGSVASLITAILEASGMRAGLYTSPHLVHFRERFRLDGQNPDDTLLAGLAAAVEAFDDPGQPTTFFEFTTAMAFLLFARRGLDMAVMETGMGGRWDATTACHPAVCVITTIAMDHREFLGNSPEAIAGEKAGIIKPGIPVVTGVRQPEALEVIRKQADLLKAPLRVLGEDFHIRDEGEGLYTYEGKNRISHLRPALAGKHQAQNLALALATLESLEEQRPGFRLSEKAIRQGLEHHTWPARIQKLLKNPLVLLDGAHNPEAAAVLAEYLEHHTPSPRTLLFGVLEDKDAPAMLEHLLPLFSRVVLTRPDTPRSRNPETLIPLLPENLPLTVEPDVKKALSLALSRTPESGCLCIAGSLYLAGEILAIPDLPQKV